MSVPAIINVSHGRGSVALLTEFGLNAETLPLSRDLPSWYHPGRAGLYHLGPKPIARFGEIHPGLLEKLDIDYPVVAFEILSDQLPRIKEKGPAKKLLKNLTLQPLKRDFAFVVGKATPVDDILRAAAGAERKLITDVHLFDIYSGKGISDNEKSVAITVTLQPEEKTLTDQEIEAVSDKIIGAVQSKTDARLRG